MTYRTDQLDGETDWKLRIAVPITQPQTDEELSRIEGEIYGPYLNIFSLIDSN